MSFCLRTSAAADTATRRVAAADIITRERRAAAGDIVTKERTAAAADIIRKEKMAVAGAAMRMAAEAENTTRRIIDFTL